MMSPSDFEKMARELEELREFLRSMVANVEAEGFTPEQAREIVTRLIVMGPDEESQ